MTQSGSGIVIRDIAYQAEGTFLAIVMESMFLFLFFSLSIRRNTKRQRVWQAGFFQFSAILLNINSHRRKGRCN